MRTIFYNTAENRLRAGWRITLFFATLGLVSTGILFLAEAIIGGRPAPGLGREFLAIGIIALVITALIKPGRKFLDKRSVISMGLRFDGLAVKDLLFGWVLSGLLAGLFFTVLWMSGNLEITGMSWTAERWVWPLLGYFVLHLIVGYWEELFFRGYIFDNLNAGLGLKLAIVVSCLMYGIIHGMNPNASLLSTSIIVLFGFMRLYGLLSTKQLWLSMGMHMGWNFFQGPVFGFAASGHTTFRLIQHNSTGNTWITGGDFGPEASVLMIPILVLGLAIMYWWSKQYAPRNAS